MRKTYRYTGGIVFGLGVGLAVNTETENVILAVVVGIIVGLVAYVAIDKLEDLLYYGERKAIQTLSNKLAEIISEKRKNGSLGRQMGSRGGDSFVAKRDIPLQGNQEAGSRTVLNNGFENRGFGFCRNCGEPAKRPDQEFCVKCGTPLKEKERDA